MLPPRSSGASMGVCPILVGRGQQVSDLRADVERARDGEPRVVLLNGEAGIGKSRLARATRDYGAASGMRVLLDGQCFETDRASPYAPLIDLFQAYLARDVRAEGATQADITRSFAVTLARLRPELVLQFPHLAAASESATVDPEGEKRALFAAVTHYVTQQTREQAVLLSVEDIHWCDELSLELLLHIVRRVRHAPVLVLVTYRGEDVPARMRHWLAQLDRERVAHEYVLEPLARAEVAEMLQAMLGGTRLGDELVNTLADHSEGNPFFVEELVKSLLAAGVMQCVDGVWTVSMQHVPVPRSVQEAVQQRTVHLSAEARRLATLAAVAGRRFRVDLLQAILGCDEGHLLNQLKELIGAQLVTEEAADHFTFRHALTQQAIYRDMLVRERQTLHRTIAEALAELAATSAVREQYVEELAYQSFAGAMWEQALAYGREAGERAMRLFAQQAAIEHFTYAIEAAHHLSQAAPAAPVPALYLARGQAHETLGAFERARGDYERAFDAARATQDRTSEWQAVMALGFLWTGHDYARADEWFRQALALADALGDPVLRARSLNRRGNWLLNTGRIQEALAAHEEALRLFEARADQQGTAATLDMLGGTYFFMGDPAKGVSEFFDRTIGILRSQGDRQGLIEILAARAMDVAPETIESTSSALRTRDESVHDAAEALALARELNSPSGQAFVEIATTGALFSFGEFGGALAHGLESLRIATAIEHQEWIAAANGMLGQLYLLLLDPVKALSYLDVGVEVARDLGSAIWVKQLTPYLALAHVHLRAFARAEAVLVSLLPRGQRPENFFERQAARVWGELALARGEAAEAAEIAQQLVDSAPGRGQQQHIPHLLVVKGEALLALRRVPEAAEVLEAAREGARQRQAPSVLWRIHRALGRAYHLLRRADDARAAGSAAREIITQLAATLDDTELRDRFQATALATLPRGKSSAGKAGPSTPLGALSVREREVAALVAQGKSNREIATSLVVSERTAEAHVSHILAKLGFTTRAQIAAWVAEAR